MIVQPATDGDPRRENFVPFRTGDLIAVLAEDGRLDAGDAAKFRALCRLLASLYREEYGGRLQGIADAFAPFDPDADTRPIRPVPEEDLPRLRQDLFDEVEALLERANYEKLGEEDLELAMAERSLVAFDLKVDFEDFEQVLLFRRGLRKDTVRVTRGFFAFRRTAQIEVESYERVVLLLHYRGREHLAKRGRDSAALPFEPGKLYVQLFKNVPRADLDLLFPNVRVGMTRGQKAFFVVPAVLGGIPILLKIVLSATALITALAIFLGLRKGGDAAALAGATAGLTGLLALGGFLFRQYSKFKGTLTRFLKGVSEQLFFKNLDTNMGVFRAIVHAASQEETKEAILAYYHLLTGGPQAEAALDAGIERWFTERLDADVDFEVDDALRKLHELGLAETTAGGEVRVRPLDEALRRLDERWDRIFEHE